MEPLVCAFTISHRYAVHFTRGAFRPENVLFSRVISEIQPRRLVALIEQQVVATNPTLADSVACYFRKAEIQYSSHILPGGEDSKQSESLLKHLYRVLEQDHVCRHSCVVIVGGGAFLDVCGFAAATFHRGMPIIRFPTTLLAQADAGVGVKNGINSQGKKNLIGTFAPPLAVINDLDFLATLDRQELRAGYAEAVKVALIRDAKFFDWIEMNAGPLRCGEADAVEYLVRRCAELHLRHIAEGGDPFECGSRRPLDFGHWAAHKLEQMSQFRLRHGDAVAVGIALDCLYAAKAGYLDRLSLERILTLLQQLGLPIFAPELFRKEELLQGLDEFREHLGGNLCITLLKAIGDAWEANSMDLALIVAAIDELNIRAQT